MRRSGLVNVPILSLALTVCTLAAAEESQADKDKERQEIRARTQQILAQLYKVEPSASANIQRSAGYAVFSNFGMKIFVAGSGLGKGIAVDTKSKKETFMKMVELQGGLGLGVKKFSLVWVFGTPETLATFINSGWELGAQGSAAAKAGEKGAAFQDATAIAPDIWLYQLTDKGVALELTAKGTRYYKNDSLN